MIYELTMRPYTAGIGQPQRDKLVEIEGETLPDAIAKYYDRPDFNPEYRVVNVACVYELGVPSDKGDEENAANKNRTVRP